jgi:hypothetical protein
LAEVPTWKFTLEDGPVISSSKYVVYVVWTATSFVFPKYRLLSYKPRFDVDESAQDRIPAPSVYKNYPLFPSFIGNTKV